MTPQDRAIIIAEAGVNHNGDLGLARELVAAAAQAGADFVKFQTFKADKLASKLARKAGYQEKNHGKEGLTQHDMLKKLELPEEWHFELIDHAKARGISFLSTGFDEDSVDFLIGLGMTLIKIPSGEITNKPYLMHVAGKQRPVILSTGMATLSEVRAAIAVMEQAGLRRTDLTILHCNTQYPTPMKDVNLLAMKTLAAEFGVRVGYSDHTMGIEVPIAAVALGAQVIEKHFTLDRNMPGPDHQASLEPAELKAMVQGIRNIQSAMSGSGRKEPTESELPNIFVARKSIHLKKKIYEGEIISSAHLTMKRPGDGISPMEIDNVIGRVVKHDLNEDTKLTWEQLQK